MDLWPYYAILKFAFSRAIGWLHARLISRTIAFWALFVALAIIANVLKLREPEVEAPSPQPAKPAQISCTITIPNAAAAGEVPAPNFHCTANAVGAEKENAPSNLQQGARTAKGAGWRTVLLGLRWSSIVGASAFLGEFFVGYSALWLFLWEWARKKPMVLAATTCRGGADLAAFSNALPIEIVSRLTRLTELLDQEAEPALAAVDAGNRIAAIAGRVDKGPEFPRLTVADAGIDVSKFVTDDSKLKLAWLEVPLRPIIEAFRRINPNPSLDTTLAQIGCRITIVAATDRPRRQWRVEREVARDAGPGELSATIYEATEELVDRIFATLAEGLSPDWRAVRSFMQGLRALAAIKSHPIDKTRLLIEAETHFFDAQVRDGGFSQAAYNLAVVMLQRGDRKDAALAVLEEALKQSPMDVKLAYGLSYVHWRAGRLAIALQFAERAIRFERKHPEAWQMKGFLWRGLYAASQPRNRTAFRDAWRKTIVYRKRAARYAWNRMCRRARRGQWFEGDRQAVKTPLINLGVGYTARAQAGYGEFKQLEFGNGVRVLRLATLQVPTSDTFFELGKTIEESGDCVRAVSAYKKALDYAPNIQSRLRMRAYGASAATRSFEAVSIFDLKSKAYFAERAAEMLTSALRTPSKFDADIVRQISIAASKMGYLRVERLAQLLDKVLSELGARFGAPNASLDQFRQELTWIWSQEPDVIDKFPNLTEIESLNREADLTRRWIENILDISEFEALLRDPTTEGSSQCLETFKRYSDRVDFLKKNFASDDWTSFVLRCLAYHERTNGDAISALSHARAATELAPSDISSQFELGSVNHFMRDFDASETSFQRAIALAPDDSAVIATHGYVAWERGVTMRDLDTRKAEFHKTIESFGNAALVAGANNNDDLFGYFNYWLGRFHLELRNSDAAIKHFEIAKARKKYVAECAFYLGWCAYESKRYDAAETQFSEALSGLEKDRGAFEQDSLNAKLSWWVTTDNETRRLSETLPPVYLWLRAKLFVANLRLERGARAGAAQLLGEARTNFEANWPPTVAASATDGGAASNAAQAKRDEIEAQLADFAGWLSYCNKDNDRARNYLELSASKRDSAENQFHLALLQEAEVHSAEARRRVKRARELDDRNVYKELLDELEKRLDARDAPPPAAPAMKCFCGLAAMSPQPPKSG